MTGRQSGALKIALLLLLPCWVVGTNGSHVQAWQQEPAATAPASPAAATGRGGRGPVPVDSRVQIRSYRFTETDEDLPYALFVSSKVRPETKAPLIVALHGLGGTHTTLTRGNALDLAEEGGYILVGPRGYSPSGWYGAPPVGGPGRRGRGAGAPATPVSRPWAAQMKQLNMTHRYIEVPGGDHGNVISIGMPDIYAFFGAHTKTAR